MRTTEAAMRLARRARIVAAATGAAALVAGLGTTPVFAPESALASGSTWTVTPGGSYLGSASGQVWELRDLRIGSKVNCSGSGFSAGLVQFKSGSGLVNPIGDITAVTFPSSCETPAGPLYLIPGGLPWPVRALSYTASTGTTLGALRHIHLALSGTACSAVIDGTGPAADNGVMPFTWDNKRPGALSAFGKGSNLHAYDVTGCSGFLGTGDPVRIFANYVLSNPVNPPPTITSP